jgi:uroporphyrinogen-III synthase
MRILVTRPEPEGSRMKAQLEAAGHEVMLEALLQIEPLAIDPAAFDGAQALIATSRNSLRALALGPALNAALKLPVFTVGPGTAQGPLVHIAGEVTAFDIAAALAERGFEVRTSTAYRAVAAASLSETTAQSITDSSLHAVILMSPRSANIFAQLVADRGLEAAARRLVFLCLSQAVADSVHCLAPARVEIAEEPNTSAMLAAVGRVASGCAGV